MAVPQDWPSTSQTEVEGQAIASACPEPEGSVSLTQLLPPLVVRMAVPEDWPSTSQTEVEGQAIASACPEPEGSVSLTQVLPPSVVRKAKSPSTASQTRVEGQATVSTPVTPAGSASLTHLVPPSVVRTAEALSPPASQTDPDRQAMALSSVMPVESASATTHLLALLVVRSTTAALEVAPEAATP